MNRPRFNFEVICDPSWWHWATTVPLLALHLAGYSWAGWAAIGLCTVMAGYYFLQLRKVRPYPVQVRLAYMLLLVCGMPPGMSWIHCVPLVGTTAMVVAGYCPLVRMLKLAPWNRTEPLSQTYVWQVIVRMPCAGGLIRWSPTEALSGTPCCSMQEHRLPNSSSILIAPDDRACVSEKVHANIY